MVVLRPKVPSDTDGLVALALEVHRVDGYPRYLPDDLADFMTPGYEEAGWVADVDGRIVGHVALHRAAEDPTLPAAQRQLGSARRGWPSWRAWWSLQPPGGWVSLMS